MREHSWTWTQEPLNFPSAVTMLMVHLPLLKIVAQSSLPAVLCHAPEKGYIFLVQLDHDAIDTDPGASGNHYS